MALGSKRTLISTQKENLTRAVKGSQTSFFGVGRSRLWIFEDWSGDHILHPRTKVKMGWVKKISFILWRTDQQCDIGPFLILRIFVEHSQSHFISCASQLKLARSDYRRQACYARFLLIVSNKIKITSSEIICYTCTVKSVSFNTSKYLTVGFRTRDSSEY